MWPFKRKKYSNTIETRLKSLEDDFATHLESFSAFMTEYRRAKNMAKSRQDHKAQPKNLSEMLDQHGASLAGKSLKDLTGGN